MQSTPLTGLQLQGETCSQAGRRPQRHQPLPEPL